MRAPAALVLIAAILALAIVLRADLVIEESRFAGTYVAPLISAWPYTTPSYNDTSVLVTGLIVNARNSGPKAGAIAIHDSDWQSAFVLDHIYQMQKDGAAAVVLGTTYGRGVWVLRELIKEKGYPIHIPVFQCRDMDFEELYEATLKGEAVNGTLTADRLQSEFALVSDSVWSVVWQVCGMVLPSLAAGVFCAVRLGQYVYYQRKKLSIAKFVLSFLLLSNLLRVWMAASDPFGMRSWMNPFFPLFFYTTPMPFQLAANFIVLFYWNAALHSFGTKPINWMKRYVYGLIGVMFVLELASAILRGLDLVFAVLLICQAFYIILQLILIGYICFTAWGLYKYFKTNNRSKNPQPGSQRKVIRMTRLLVVSSFLLVMHIIITCLVLTPPARAPVGEMMVWMFAYITFAVQSVVVALVLKNPCKSFGPGGSQIGSHTNSARTAVRSIGGLSHMPTPDASSSSSNPSPMGDISSATVPSSLVSLPDVHKGGKSVSSSVPEELTLSKEPRSELTSSSASTSLTSTKS